MMAMTADLIRSESTLAAEPAADPIIRLQHVGKRYGDHVIIEDLNLDIVRGEFLTLLGPSGCGKTTTLKMIAGFETPSEGHILLDGQEMSGVPPYRRPLNTVFQQYALFPHMTVFDNVAFGPRTARVEKSQVKSAVEAALATVGMSAHAPKKPDQLSGGQQQRIALARALVNRPKALLLDEPLSALDVKLRRAMQLELKRIHTEVRTTFIFVTHDQDEALTMSSRIAVMNGGKIEQLDAPETIYRRPATRFVAGFIGQANLLAGVVEQAAPQGSGTTAVSLSLYGSGQGSGIVHATGPAGLSTGQKVLLVLRPEQASLCLADDGGSGDESGFTARLRSFDFQGSTCRYALMRDDGQEVVVTVLPQHQLAGAEPGAPVRVRWDRNLVWVVPDTARQGEI